MYAISKLADGRTSFRMIASHIEILSGEEASLTPPSQTMEDVIAELIVNVQSWLDVTVAQNGYDSLASCISYKDSAIVQWALDAAAALAWRDAVWQAVFAWQQSAMANPPATFPTSVEVITQLPQPETFGWVNHQPGVS